MQSKRDIILQKLKDIYKSDIEVDIFLSTPNKFFHFRSPGDCLEAGDYQIFFDLFGREE